MHPLQQQLDNLRKYHEALGTKLASLERHLEADGVLQAPTMERQNYAVSSDSSVMHEGRRYSFKYMGIDIENVLVFKSRPVTIETDYGDFNLEYITNVREVKEPAKEWEIVEFKCTGRWDGKDGLTWIKDGDGTFGDDCKFSEQSMLEGHFGSVKDGQWAIHAVRRLSDGTVWRVGDIFNQAVIDAFDLFIDGNMWVCGQGLRLKITSDELKRPEPLFTTADGVGVFSRQTRLWWLRCVNGNVADIWDGIEQVWVDMPGRTNDVRFWKPFAYRIYSTREAAQAAYDKWLFDQQVLTLRDLEFRGISGHQWGILKQFVKDKIAKK